MSPTIATPLTVAVADGSETFIGIGGTEEEHPSAGEVVFVDAVGALAARRWCGKQGAAGATVPTTVNAVYVIEAVHADAAVTDATDDLGAVIRRHFPGADDQRLLATP